MLCIWRFTSILGIVVVLLLMSAKDKLERKKNKGVWRWESELMTRMMSRFPSMATRYMDRKSPKRRGCRSGSSERPRRRNSETPVRFCGFLLMGHLSKKVESVEYTKQC